MKRHGENSIHITKVKKPICNSYILNMLTIGHSAKGKTMEQ